MEWTLIRVEKPSQPQTFVERLLQTGSGFAVRRGDTVFLLDGFGALGVVETDIGFRTVNRCWNDRTRLTVGTMLSQAIGGLPTAQEEELAQLRALFAAVDSKTPLKLGSIKVGASLFICDPCYLDNPSNRFEFSSVAGTWVCEMSYFQDGDGAVLPCALSARHISTTEGYASPGVEIGVDSGQVGVFTSLIADYDAICDTTLPTIRAGLVDNHAVSSTAFGDGGHAVSVWGTADGLVSAIRIDLT